MKKYLFILALLVSSLSHASIKLGQDYELLATPQPVRDSNKIEIIEFFSYQCSYCYTKEKALSAWVKALPKDVSFRKEHIVWNKSMENMARMFASFSMSNTLAKLHNKAFDAVLKDRINLADEKEFEKWLKNQKGINANSVLDIYHSFSASAQVERAKKITNDYAVRSTPLLIINGQYVVPSERPECTMKVVDELIENIRAGLN
ncbi:MAG: thiol:disulfide interchange protein DsbA/DsbL [Burkholderiales bacterium]|nr:thiol:disulfide interchange protein DsbA/DsbL [Burkholderiales bacterium]